MVETFVGRDGNMGEMQVELDVPIMEFSPWISFIAPSNEIGKLTICLARHLRVVTTESTYIYQRIQDSIREENHIWLIISFNKAPSQKAMTRPIKDKSNKKNNINKRVQ